MSLRRYLHKALTLPPHIVLRKATSFIKQQFQDQKHRWQDTHGSTYVSVTAGPTGKLLRYFKTVPTITADDQVEQISQLSALYLDHRFDLLGSGWVQVQHGMACRGLEGYFYKMGSPITPDPHGHWLSGRINPANLNDAQHIWTLIAPDYTPIDWHLDFKSGYRWSESTWYLEVPYGHQPGVDIKVPWELARMQHLPMLAWAYRVARQDQDGLQRPQVYAREFRNQILDFIATNPPRFGVNWRCTMDVAIRVVNWLVAYDLFRTAGAEFDADFEIELNRSVYEHGLHIINHLEWSPELRSNHYLSDIAGLLFVAAYLPRTLESDRWLAFATQELIAEMTSQFHSDGSNFEASTSYHRLSAEIIAYSAALCLSLPQEKREALQTHQADQHSVQPGLKPYAEQAYCLDWPELLPVWFWERLEKAGEFTLHITKPSGVIPQFGDNDSGRFLKLWPTYIRRTVAEAVGRYDNLAGYHELPSQITYWDEVILDHQHLVKVIGCIFQRSDLQGQAELARLRTPEVTLLQTWLKQVKVPSYHADFRNPLPLAEGRVIQGDRSLPEWQSWLTAKYGSPLVTEFRAAEKSILTAELQAIAYPDFGFYLYRSPQLYLAIRCGSIGQNGRGGHAHNDQLGIELTISGKDIIWDPGTYVYTPLPDQRNKFRSTGFHFTPQISQQEQNDWLDGVQGLFSLKNQAQAKCLYFMADGFLGKHDGFDVSVYRIIQLEEAQVKILDYGRNVTIRQTDLYSDGYGRLITADSP